MHIADVVGDRRRRAFLIDYCAYAVLPVLVMAAVPHLPEPPDTLTDWLLGLLASVPLSRAVYVLVITPLLARRTPPARTDRDAGG